MAVAVLAAAVLVAAPAAAQGAGGGFVGRLQQVSAASFDLLVLRTTGFVRTCVGTAFFVPAAVIAAPGGLDPIREGFERFVEGPGSYTFTRPLGDF